jgi:hypothetical protein
MFTRTTFDFATGVAAAVVLFATGVIISIIFAIVMRVTRS